MRCDMAETALARFIAALKKGNPYSKDPFDPNFFDLTEHLIALEEGEKDAAGMAISGIIGTITRQRKDFAHE
jgi:hypothetical protein